MARTIKETVAVYSTILDQVQSTGETLIIEKDGKPTVAVVPFDEYAQLVSVREDERKSAWQQEQEHLMQIEIAVFERMKPELLKTYRGKWVAIVDGQLVDADAECLVLSERMTAKYGERTMLIEQVLDKPRIYIIDSPELVRE